VVFSPYISLTKLLESDAQLADLSQNAWAALNDVYRTDAPIVYAPHVLALGCLYLASVICSRDITAWLEGVEADMDQVWLIQHSRESLCGACRRCWQTHRRPATSLKAAEGGTAPWRRLCVHESRHCPCPTQSSGLLASVVCCLQVYAVCLDLINMYENYRVPISQEECRRLLSAVRPPHPAPAAAAAGTPPPQH
jgi:hypothetical protein